jgi:hypothetical protein
MFRGNFTSVFTVRSCHREDLQTMAFPFSTDFTTTLLEFRTNGDLLEQLTWSSPAFIVLQHANHLRGAGPTFRTSRFKSADHGLTRHEMNAAVLNKTQLHCLYVTVKTLNKAKLILKKEA